MENKYIAPSKLEFPKQFAAGRTINESTEAFPNSQLF